jgi:hypothetical protein
MNWPTNYPPSRMRRARDDRSLGPTRRQMLYIEDTDGSVWLDVVNVLREREAYSMVLCLYPGSSAEAFPAPFALAEAPEYLERVTTYPGGDEPPCSGRVRVSEGLLDSLRPHVGDFEDWGDSFALYPLHEREWTAAFIPHERVVLVSDVRLHDFLDAAGIAVGLERPDGW